MKTSQSTQLMKSSLMKQRKAFCQVFVPYRVVWHCNPHAFCLCRGNSAFIRRQSESFAPSVCCGDLLDQATRREVCLNMFISCSFASSAILALLDLCFNLLTIALGQLLCACSACPQLMLRGIPRCDGFVWTNQRPRTMHDCCVKKIAHFAEIHSCDILKYSLRLSIM